MSNCPITQRLTKISKDNTKVTYDNDNNDKQRLSKISKDNKKVTYHLEMKSNPELGQINFRTCDLVDEILVRL